MLGAATEARRWSSPMCAFLALCASAALAGTRGIPLQLVPPSAVSPSAMDLRTAPRQIHETADSIFVVRDDCLASADTVRVDEYAKTTLTARQLVIAHCGRFAGNVISAIGADERNIYIKFGTDDEVGGQFNGSEPFNLLELDRKSQKELTVARSTAWIDLLDASGPDLVGCHCIGTMAHMATRTCIIAKKARSNIRFIESDVPAGVACLGGPNAVAAARIFVGENGRWVSGGVAANERYVIEPFSNATTAVYTVESPTRKLNLVLPPEGYEVAGLGTGATSQRAAVFRKNERTITVAIESIPDAELTELIELPASGGKEAWPKIHVYAEWLVAANDDTVLIHQMAPPNRSFMFKTENRSWILAADLYGHVLYVRSVPIGAGSNRELPALQIDLDLLKGRI